MRFAPGTKIISIALITSLCAVVSLGALRNNENAQNTQVVPVEFANKRGALEWDDRIISEFVQDPNNQVLLSAEDIEARNLRGALDWLPSSAPCRYLSNFITVMKRYELKMEPGELHALASKRQRCTTQFQ